jgi:regulation of enolase protein 1 (concanavalin A-like superfamily)
VNTRDGRDKDAHFVGLGTPGDDLRLRLSRLGGKFTLAVENRTSGATSTLAIRHPAFLDGRADIVAGVFACDPRGNDHKAVRFGEFSATVWVHTPSR